LIAYASRTGTVRNLRALADHGWRLLVSAEGEHRTEGFAQYAIDNGAWSAFAQGRPFNEASFGALLRSHGAGADWTVLPDIVAGGLPSLEMSLRWMRRVLDETPRALLAVQDGMVDADVRAFIGPRVGIFVGGSTAWKLDTLRAWGALARELGAWCHVGRVNTARRIRACTMGGATSFDGTSATRFASTIPLLDHARRQPSLWGAT
jgi:hypothetical protein